MTPLLIAHDEQIEGTQTEANQTDIASSRVNSSLVGFASNVGQIRGHLEQPVSNKDLGNLTIAKAHPMEEIYGSIKVQIDSSDPTLNQSLSSSLNQLSSSVDNSTIEEFKTKGSDLNGLLNNTLAEIIPNQ
jgi:hypothetical protein